MSGPRDQPVPFAVLAGLLLLATLAQFAATGENDWLWLLVVGEPALLAAYLWRAERPPQRSVRLLACLGLLLPAILVVAFFVLLAAIYVMVGPESWG